MVDLLEVSLCLLEVYQEQVVIAKVNLRIPDELGIANLV